ncbi:SLC13 family permease [Candidatus Woesearchaeota archaeon]|nr:SLC13 family permease [Candidatus Woesearchaeota archaeon]MBW3022042.1 SLC13 family permease [Candidatus Woesearchaeota archaeon]
MKKLITKLLPVLFFILLYFLVQPSGLSPAAWKAIIIFLITAYLWATETINIAITAIAVIFMLMLTGTVSPLEALSGFGSSALFLVIIGFLIAFGLMASGLDKRIANYFLKHCKKESTILLGIIGITALLSMIMTNTTTTLLMLPIVARIANKTKMSKVPLFIITAFSANIGGIGLLIGTPPNIIAADVLQLNFNQWFIVGFPFMLVMLGLLYLSFYLYFKPRSKCIKIRTKKLPKISKKEKTASIIILATLALWFTSPLHNISTITIGLLGGLALLLTVYDWKYFAKKTDWGVVFLVGGAISLGYALQTTGAALWLAQSFLTITGLQSPLWIAFGFVVLSLLITQFIQNTATAAIMAPVLVGIATGIGVAPAALVIPMAIGVSMAFMLPSATAPNAIAFNKANIKIKDMAKLGLLPTALALCSLFVLCWILI